MQAEFPKSLSALCMLWEPCSHLSSAQALGTIPHTPPHSFEVHSCSLSFRASGFQDPFSENLLTFFFPPREGFALSWCNQNLLLFGNPTVTPYLRQKHFLLNLTSFAQFNKKGFHTILNRYIQHGRPIPQMKLVPFKVVEIIVRSASMAYLQKEVNM